MKRTFGFFLLAAVLLFIFSGCSDISNKREEISIMPTIKFISMTPASAIKNFDKVVITFEFTDGDGDLGDNTPDVKNLFCTDSRNSVTYEYRIPQLAPDNANIIIKGQQAFELPAQGFVDDNHTSETATYSVYVIDRAGNQSNTVTTDVLTIHQ